MEGVYSFGSPSWEVSVFVLTRIINEQIGSQYSSIDKPNRRKRGRGIERA